MAENLPITEETVYGLLIAIECLQEVLIARRVTDPEELSLQYDKAAQPYFEAGRAEAAVILEILIARLRDPDRLQRRHLIRSKPAGSA